ncbi:MAG: LrgB family protein [Firmicutes bacterium]|nr:LrgB family protein [Alicyclobacillaceae bacterium]MCL6496858.1 LrgB family protein [Bacillota bacterium]
MNAVWLAVTVLLFGGLRRAERPWSRGWALPVAAVALWGGLNVFGVPPAAYSAATGLLTFWLGPATVAMAVPLVRHWPAIARRWPRVLVGVGAGAAVSTGIAALLSWWWGLGPLWRSVLPHTATTPIALPLVAALGGTPALGAVATVLTGLVGSLIGPAGLGRMGIQDPLAQGVALGAASSGIGTARALAESPAMGAVAGLAMALAGLAVTAMVLPWAR